MKQVKLQKCKNIHLKNATALILSTKFAKACFINIYFQIENDNFKIGLE